MTMKYDFLAPDTINEIFDSLLLLKKYTGNAYARSIRKKINEAEILKTGERMLFGSYSASADLQKESARLVFSGELPVEQLVSHRVPLDRITYGFQLALHPEQGSLKIIVQPQRWS